MGRRHGKTPTYPKGMVIVESVLDGIKIQIQNELLRPVLLRPLSFWQKIWRGENNQPSIGEYLYKIEERQFQLNGIDIDTFGRREDDDEKKRRLAKKEWNLLANGISPMEALKRRRQRKAWKAMWVQIFPPVIRKTASKKKVGIVRKEVPKKGAAGEESKANEGLVMVRMTGSTCNETTVDMECMMNFAGIMKELEVIKKKP